MKILVCASEYPPHASGIGNVAERMVREFRNRGHTCTVCSPTGPDINLGSSWAIQRLGGLGLIYFWERVRRHFSSGANQWDAVWLHWPTFLGACPFRGAVVTFHGTYRGFRGMARETGSPPWIKGYYNLMSATERRYLARLDSASHVFTAVSRRSVAELRLQGVNASDIEYVPVGVDTDKFRPATARAELRKELGIPLDVMVLLYVGRLSRPKNLFRLIDTFEEARGQLKDALLLMAGSGELQEPLSQYIRERNIPNIRLLGYVPHEELPKVYGAADYFVMSSTYEGQPVALLEAMSAGLPPILSHIPVMAEVVEESGVGIVVDFDDPARASARIADYVSSDVASLHGSMAREYVVTNMSSPMCAERYLDLLRKVSRSL